MAESKKSPSSRPSKASAKKKQTGSVGQKANTDQTADAPGKKNIAQLFNQLKELEKENAKLVKDFEKERKERAQYLTEMRAQQKQSGEKLAKLNRRIERGRDFLERAQAFMEKIKKVQARQEKVLERLSDAFEKIQQGQLSGSSMPQKPSTAVSAGKKSPKDRKKRAVSGSPGASIGEDHEISPEELKKQLAGLLGDVKKLSNTRAKLQNEIDRMRQS